jgi:hypothetical protein
MNYKGTTTFVAHPKKKNPPKAGCVYILSNDYSPLMVTPTDNRFIAGPEPSFNTPVI